MSTPLRIPQNFQNKVNKSMHDLSTIKRTTINAGIAYPLYRRHLMAGDKFNINISSLLQSNPLQGPLMGSYILRAITVFDADANRYGWLDNNDKLSTAQLLNKNKHRFTSTLPVLQPETYSNYVSGNMNRIYEVCKGGLWDYLGVSPRTIKTDEGGNLSPYGSCWNADFALTYLNAFRTFLCNNQESRFPVTRLYVYNSGNISDDSLNWADLTYLDKIFRKLRMMDDGFDFGEYYDSSPEMQWLTDWLTLGQQPQGGLFPCTFEPDIYRNLLSSQIGTVASTVSTGGNSFTIDTLRFQNKLQRYIDRLDVSGGRFSDWLRTVWGVKTRRNLDQPDLIGVHSEFIDPSNITSVANTETMSGEGSSIGQLAGNFDNYNKKSRTISFTASEPGNVMIIVMLVPLVDYSCNIQPDLLTNSFADDYNPEFAQLGFQKVPRVAYTSTIQWLGALPASWQTEADEPNENSTTVGKQVAWLDEMTDVNRCHGEFADGGDYEYWVLKRKYMRSHISGDGSLRVDKFDLTQYINPLDFQYPFVGQTLLDNNFFLQVRFDIQAIRPIGKRFMPNLE